MAMKITAKQAKQTAQEVNTRREEERKQKSLEHLNGAITEQIVEAMNNGETSITIRTNKELDWDLIEAELRKEENGFSATRPASNNGTLRIGW
jgi:hypothetical protein